MGASSRKGDVFFIQVGQGTPREEEVLRSLYKWLREDSRLRAMARIELSGTEPRVEHMGPTIDAVKVALECGLNGIGLAAAIASWLQAREAARRTIRLTIRKDGSAISITSADRNGVNDVIHFFGGER
jgi:hypothetical protein